jgi:hypothetical protein
MKLSEKTTDIIIEAVRLSNNVGIEGLIFDEHGVRGYNDDEGVIVASLKNHNFEFASLGLSRLGSFKKKLRLLDDSDTLEVSADTTKPKEDANLLSQVATPDEMVETLKFKCGKIKFEYRCASPHHITDIPKKSLNLDPVFQFMITKDDISTISKGYNAMTTKNMEIIGKGGNVEFKFTDETGDSLNFSIDGDLESIGDDKEVTLTINLKKMLPIMSMAAQDGNFTINILKMNIVHIVIGELDVIVMPEVS